MRVCVCVCVCGEARKWAWKASGPEPTGGPLGNCWLLIAGQLAESDKRDVTCEMVWVGGTVPFLPFRRQMKSAWFCNWNV